MRHTDLLKLLVVIAALLALILTGCSQEITEPVKTDEIAGAPETPQGLQTLVADGQVRLTWTISSAAQINRFMIYRGDTSSTALDLIDSTTATNYVDSDLRNGLRYIYQVSSIGTNGLESKLSRPVSATPNVFSIQISNGATYTNTRNVTVNLTAPTGTRFVKLGNQADLTTAQWSSFAASKSWELTSGDGTKQVYAAFRDAENNVTLEGVSDEIILDTRASILSVTENSNGQTLTAGSTILFTVDAGEVGGKASVDVGSLGNIELLDVDPNITGSFEDGIYQSLYTVPGAVDVVDAVVKANFTDAAGNSATPRNATTFINIANPPNAVALTAYVVSETEIDLSWTRSQASDFARYLVFRSRTASVSTNDELVSTITSASNSTFNNSDLDPNTTYRYAVYTVDASGLMSKSNEVTAKTFANEAPAAVTLFVSDDDSTSVTLGWTVSDEDDFESYRIFRSTSATVNINNNDNLIGVVTSRTSNSYTDNNVNQGTVYNYVVVVYDRFGAKSPASNQVSGPNP